MCGYCKRKLINTFILLLATCNLHNLNAQKNEGVLKGRIIEADGSAGVNMNVVLKKLNKITVTDNNGAFMFQHLPATLDTLLISSVEIKSLVLPVTIYSSQISDAGIIKLNYNVHQLESVEIRGRSTASYKSDYSFFGNKTETPSKDIPQSISSVTKELIQDKMEFTLKDAVDEVAGVNQYSGYDEYTIRGFRAENARDINGLRGYNTTYTSSMLVNIERIEVIKGPTATLYGNCDPGGTINLVTKKPLEKQEAEINFYAGKWKHYRAEADVTGPFNQSKTLLYRLNTGYNRSSSFRNNYKPKSYEIAPSLSFIPNDKLKMNFDFSLSHFNASLDRGQPGYQNNQSLTATPINLSLTQKGDYLHETNIASNLTVFYKLNNHLSFNSAWLNYSTNQNVTEHGLHNYITPDSVSLYYSAWHYPAHTNTLTNYFIYKAHTGKVSYELLFGYDFIKSKTELNQRYYELPDEFGVGSGVVGTFSLKSPIYVSRPISNYQLSSYDADATNVDAEAFSTQGIYQQDLISINRWKFLLSVRQEIYKFGGDDDDNQSQEDDAGKEKVFLPRVGIVYSLKPNLNLYATYNKGFDPFEATTATQVFDEPFKPLTSELYEAGAKANLYNNALSAVISIYQLAVHNVAVNANDISNPSLFVQQGKNRSRGIEAEATGNVLPNLSLYITYAYSECKIVKSKIASQVGTLAENTPRNTSGSYLKYTFNKGIFKGFGLSAGHSYVSRRTTLDPDIKLPDYLIFNAGVQYEHSHIKIAVLCNNITNKTYWTGAYNNIYKWPGEPIDFMVNLSYSFK